MADQDLPFAEDINYWKTGTSSPDTWVDNAIKQIQALGGTVRQQGFGSDTMLGREAYMLTFEIDGQTYKIVWPVLHTKGNDNRSARRQAATMLYHDVKARCISATVLGARVAFFAYMQLPGGQTAALATSQQLHAAMPSLFCAEIQPALTYDYDPERPRIFEIQIPDDDHTP